MNDLFLSFYGDDFTGSTDVMEVLEQSGIHTVLFLDPPTHEQLRAIPGVRAFGVAGISRTMSPAQMDTELVPILERISAMGATLFHYKICSTFDSARETGSIGRAAEIIRRLYPHAPIPVIVGVPQLGRFTVFGNLFATFGSGVYRLDRHPAMSVHPSTPMAESDLRRVLADQTALQVDLVDLRQESEMNERLESGGDLVLLDVADVAQQRAVGAALSRYVDRAREAHHAVPVIGSAGVEYALAAAAGEALSFSARGGEDRRPTLVVVGSRAPATLVQTAAALDAGFHGICLTPGAVVSDPLAVAAAATEAAAVLSRGGDVILSLTPTESATVDGVELAKGMARLTAAVAERVRISRLVVAGGDTSGFVARAIGIDALRMLRLLAPGSPLCEVISTDPLINGLEVCLKGGAIGEADFFVRVAGGQPVRRGAVERKEF